MSRFGVLIVIDVQQGFHDPRWGRRDNPGCERNVAALIAEWRRCNVPIVFVRHDSQSPESPLFSESPGNAFKSEVGGEPDLLVVKHVNSAFYGSPDLHAWLQDHGHHALTICGITTNHCCETTARMAGNLSYETTFAIDATHTFDRRSLDGSWISAEEIANQFDRDERLVSHTRCLISDRHRDPPSGFMGPWREVERDAPKFADRGRSKSPRILHLDWSVTLPARRDLTELQDV